MNEFPDLSSMDEMKCDVCGRVLAVGVSAKGGLVGVCKCETEHSIPIGAVIHGFMTESDQGLLTIFLPPNIARLAA